MCIIFESIKVFRGYLEFIYPRDLEIKETSETVTSFSCLGLHYIDNGKLTSRHFDKRDDFTFSNIPSAPTDDVYVSQVKN